jgi:ferrous iron transport protein A
MISGRQRTPLSHLLPGQKAHISGLRGGRAFRQRITSLGLNIGCEVEMMKNEGHTGSCGPVLVRAGDTRLMLGHRMAEHVMIHRG